MMDSRELKTLFHSCMPLFLSLGDEVRLTIIEVLVNSGTFGQEGMNVKEITEKTSLSRPAISHHLKILKNAGLVGVRRSGTCNYYYLTIQEPTSRLMELGRQLTELLSGPDSISPDPRTQENLCKNS